MLDSSLFAIESGVLTAFHGGGDVVRIPGGVTEIRGSACFGRFYDPGMDRYVSKKEPGAFEDDREIREVILPSSLRRIGRDAFANCRSLSRVIFSEGLSSLGEKSFAGCISLQELSLPSSLEEIGEGAFEDCHRLRTVSLPSGVRSVGKRAFAYCRSLEELVFPSGLSQVGASVCLGCGALASVSFPDAVPESVFQGSLWYAERQKERGRCPVCGGPLAPDGRICLNPSCPTQYGKWER